MRGGSQPHRTTLTPPPRPPPSSMSDTMIMDTISSYLVLPNRLLVPLVPNLHDVAQLRCPLPRVWGEQGGHGAQIQGAQTPSDPPSPPICRVWCACICLERGSCAARIASWGGWWRGSRTPTRCCAWAHRWRAAVWCTASSAPPGTRCTRWASLGPPAPPQDPLPGGWWAPR